MAVQLYSRYMGCVVALLLVYCVGTSLSEEQAGGHLLELNEDNFDEVVGKADLILVEFYVDW